MRSTRFLFAVSLTFGAILRVPGTVAFREPLAMFEDDSPEFPQLRPRMSSVHTGHAQTTWHNQEGARTLKRGLRPRLAAVAFLAAFVAELLLILKCWESFKLRHNGAAAPRRTAAGGGFGNQPKPPQCKVSGCRDRQNVEGKQGLDTGCRSCGRTPYMTLGILELGKAAFL